jgi:large subunit ribosomal protein L3
MTQIFDESGVMTPVTVLEAGPCVITQLKREERDGYSAVQIGFGEAKHQAKPQAGHLKPAKANSRFLTEYRVDGDQPEMTIGDELKADVFAVGGQHNSKCCF